MIKITAATNGRTNGLKGIAHIAMKYTTKYAEVCSLHRKGKWKKYFATIAGCA